VQRPAINDSPGDPVKNRSEDFRSPFAPVVAGLGLTKPWGLRHVSPASPVTHRACGASLRRCRAVVARRHSTPWPFTGTSLGMIAANIT
jgi:hypothetical protein